MKRLFRVVCFASNDATLSCGCDVEVLHGYCPSQPNSIKCCPGSTKESDHEACDDDVEAGLSSAGSGSGGSGSGGNVNININGEASAGGFGSGGTGGGGNININNNGGAPAPAGGAESGADNTNNSADDETDSASGSNGAYLSGSGDCSQIACKKGKSLFSMCKRLQKRTLHFPKWESQNFYVLRKWFSIFLGFHKKVF